MAEEVGAAYVSLIPSARGFSRLAQREIRQELRGRALSIPVTPEFDARSLPGSLGGRLRMPVDVDITPDQVRSALLTVSRREELTVDADVSAAQLRQQTNHAVRAVEATNPTINIDADVDRPFLAKLFGRGSASGTQLGEAIGTSALSSLRQRIDAGLDGIANNPIVSSAGALIGITLGTAAAPAVGAALSAALIGGAGVGLIGLGAVILREQPQVVAAAQSLAAKLKSTLTSAAQPLVGPFVTAMGKFEQLLTDIGPDLDELFKAIAPAVVPLAEGIVGLIKGILPGVIDLAEAAVPMFKDLASTLPRLGEDIGAFFGLIADQGPGASMFFRDLLNLLGLALIAVGGFVAVLTKAYGFMREQIDGALDVIHKSAIGLGFIVEDVIGFFRRLGSFIAGVWRTVRGDTDGLVSFFKGIPGRIKSAVGNLGTLLLQAGRNVVQGLIDGIKSRFGALANVASSLAGTIRAYLPFSPAKEGPLSGSGNPFHSGQVIAADLAAGIGSGLPAVSSASSQLAGAVAAGGPMPTSAAGAVPAGATLGWADDATGDRLLDAIRDMIRINFSGDANRAFGRASTPVLAREGA